MNPQTKQRCRQLGDEARDASKAWADSFPDNYEGKVRFSLAVAHSAMALEGVTPGLKGTAKAFIDAVKAGTMLWVEEGEPNGPPREVQEEHRAGTAN